MRRHKGAGKDVSVAENPSYKNLGFHDLFMIGGIEDRSGEERRGAEEQMGGVERRREAEKSVCVCV